MDECINQPSHKCHRFNADQPLNGGKLGQQYLLQFTNMSKLRNMLTNFSGTANPVTTANISTGALYLVLEHKLPLSLNSGQLKTLQLLASVMLINLINRFQTR